MGKKRTVHHPRRQPSFWGDDIDPIWFALILRPLDGFEFPTWIDLEDAIFFRVRTIRPILPKTIIAWDVTQYALRHHWASRQKNPVLDKEYIYRIDFPSTEQFARKGVLSRVY